MAKSDISIIKGVESKDTKLSPSNIPLNRLKDVEFKFIENAIISNIQDIHKEVTKLKRTNINKLAFMRKKGFHANLDKNTYTPKSYVNRFVFIADTDQKSYVMRLLSDHYINRLAKFYRYEKNKDRYPKPVFDEIINDLIRAETDNLLTETNDVELFNVDLFKKGGSESILNSVIKLLKSYMLVFQYHCTSHPYYIMIEKKYNLTLKTVKDEHNKFNKNEDEYALYPGSLKNIHHYNVMEKLFREFHNNSIPILTIKYWVIPFSKPAHFRNFKGGASWNVAENNAIPVTNYDYNWQKPPSIGVMRIDNSVKDQMTGGGGCSIQ